VTVALLLITHRPLGQDLLEVAATILGAPPALAEALEIGEEVALDALIAEGLQRAARLDQGDGVLVLTDLYGSTPSNIALALQARRKHLRVLSGLNLPMLLRALNYAMLDLDEVARKALAGGTAGMRLCSQEDDIP